MGTLTKKSFNNRNQEDEFINIMTREIIVFFLLLLSLLFLLAWGRFSTMIEYITQTNKKFV